MNYRLILLIVFVFGVTSTFAISQKSPHGDKFKIECTTCHTTDNWTKIKENGFNHNKTHFPLVGQHKTVSCRKCHISLEFSKAKTQCSSCHTDIHEGTVGNDCERCHKSNSWIVTNIKQIHQQQGFALVGAHATIDCNRCHKSASLLRFDNIRSDCYACHQYNYDATTKPNHKAVGFGTDCQRCHSMIGQDWTSIGKGFDHGFFPLTGGHNIECGSCHIDNDYTVKLSPICTSCHGLTGAQKAKSPAHTTKFLSYSCGDCHTLQGWAAGVKFEQHESFGRIYSGTHKGKWTACTDCHYNDADYKSYCNKCHRFNSGRLP